MGYADMSDSTAYVSDNKNIDILPDIMLTCQIIFLTCQIGMSTSQIVKLKSEWHPQRMVVSCWQDIDILVIW
jgi:hypothetical protein